MANQWLTGSGVPSTGIGQVTDYYRDTVNNLVYYRENAFTWVVVPAFTPNPDGIGTTWLHGNAPPLTGQGSDGDYYYDEVQLIVYRKDGATWVPKGSLDFIGIYGVQWGNGLGAPADTVPLNNLTAGSFYLDVETSDIYFKNPLMVWELKGQLGGGGGGGSMPALVTTLAAVTALDTTHPVAASAIFELGQYFVEDVVGGITAESIGADVSGAATAAETNAKSYADGLVVGLWKDQGNFDASGGTWPADEDTIGEVAILAGFLWKVSIGGTLTGGVIVNVGDTLRALVDYASDAANQWAVTEGNIGYVPENSASKATSFEDKNNTLYPTTKAVDDNYLALNSQTLSAPQKAQVKTNINLSTADDLPESTPTPTNKYFTDGRVRSAVLTGLSLLVGTAVEATDTVLAAIGKLQKQITDLAGSVLTLPSMRYIPKVDTGTTYPVVAADVTPIGVGLLTLTNASAIDCTISTPLSLGKSIGDSVNIIQGGAGTVTVTLTGGVFVGAKTTSTTAVYSFEGETKTFVAINTTDWRVIGG